MKVDIDFEVEGESISVKFTPQTPTERVVCGALYKTTYYEQYINEDGSFQWLLSFEKGKQ